MTLILVHRVLRQARQGRPAIARVPDLAPILGVIGPGKTIERLLQLYTLACCRSDDCAAAMAKRSAICISNMPADGSVTGTAIDSQ